MSGDKVWRWVGREIVVRGECYLAIRRGRKGIPYELIPAKPPGPTAVASSAPSLTAVDFPGGRVMLQIPTGAFSGQTVPEEFRTEDVLHFTESDWDPFVSGAKSPLETKARNPIGTYKMIWKRYITRLAQGGHDVTYFNLPENVEEWAAFTARFEKNAGGARNAGKPFPLPFGSDVKAPSQTDVERETVALLNFLVIEIARAWYIPPFMLFAALQAGVSSARARSPTLAEQFLNWQRLRYAAFVKNITGEIDLKILAPLARKGLVTAIGHVTEFRPRLHDDGDDGRAQQHRGQALQRGHRDAQRDASDGRPRGARRQRRVHDAARHEGNRDRRQGNERARGRAERPAGGRGTIKSWKRSSWLPRRPSRSLRGSPPC